MNYCQLQMWVLKIYKAEKLNEWLSRFNLSLKRKNNFILQRNCFALKYVESEEILIDALNFWILLECNNFFRSVWKLKNAVKKNVDNYIEGDNMIFKRPQFFYKLLYFKISYCYNFSRIVIFDCWIHGK